MNSHQILCESHEFHRRRAEIEMEKALAAAKPSVAMLHLELAKMHREKRNALIGENVARLRSHPARCFNGTDKKG